MKIICCVIDSFGIGAAPDSAEYGDAGANTAVHIGEAVGGVRWPNLMRLGLGNCVSLLGGSIPGCPAVDNPEAAFAALEEISKGKDTTTGHWELAGIVLKKAFRTFPEDYPSFPDEIISEFEYKTGRKILGNISASGVKIIQELGDEHCGTGKPIVYTSSDSVFQIAAHEDIIPVEELYRYCEIARGICDKYDIGRVIARPFSGKSGNYTRTERRHDYSIPLPGPSLLDHLRSFGIKTTAVGKIGDIFNMRGIDISYPDKGNKACLGRVLSDGFLGPGRNEFIFANLVDTDMLYGHRRDPQGYHDSVAGTDCAIPLIIDKLEMADSIFITADHGCDPTYKGSDHTREYAPLLVLTKGKPAANLGIIKGFFGMSNYVCDLYKIPAFPGF